VVERVSSDQEVGDDPGSLAIVAPVGAEEIARGP